jgi:hypothetical protein
MGIERFRAPHYNASRDNTAENAQNPVTEWWINGY